jgi:hypothetical protein
VLTPQFLFVTFMAKFEIQPPYACLLDSIRQNTNCSRQIAMCDPLEIIYNDREIHKNHYLQYIYTVFLDFIDSFSHKDNKDRNTIKVIKSGP